MDSTQSSNTDVQTWTVKELVDARNGTSTKKRLIRIPTYQRNLVWKKNQQRELILSIKRGFPIGAMLLYKAENENGVDVFHLIDGLQRSTALKNYLEKPTTFLDIEDLPSGILEELIGTFSKYENIEGLEEKIKVVTKSWLDSLEGLDSSSGFDPKNLVELAEECFTNTDLQKKEYQDLLHKLDPFFSELKYSSSIDFQQVPILIYTGDNANLPIIFERLNHGGTQLSKYQVYAATWSLPQYFVAIENKDIVRKIKDKYLSLEEKGLILEKPDEIGNTSKFNYFEYFFGLGKHLSDKFSGKLFEQSKNGDDTDSIGFNLGALCLIGDIKKMSELPKYITENNIDINKFTNAIEDCVNIAFSILEPYIGIKANSKTGRITNIYHTEFQIASIIGKIFNSKYLNKTFELKPDWKEKEKILRKNIPYVYLYDIMKGDWSGTGDSKANERAKSSSSKYEDNISIELWEGAFQEFKTTEGQKKEVARVNPSVTSILIFKYIYGKIITQHEVLSSEFEIEHLCPVERLKKVASRGEGIPISAFGNLCLVEKEKNREKGSKTFYEFFDQSIKNGTKNSTELGEMLSDLEISRIFTNREELSFSNEFTVEKMEEYSAFIGIRFERIKRKFFELNGIS